MFFATEKIEERATEFRRGKWNHGKSNYSANRPNVSLSYKFKFKLIFGHFVTRKESEAIFIFLRFFCSLSRFHKDSFDNDIVSNRANSSNGIIGCNLINNRRRYSTSKKLFSLISSSLYLSLASIFHRFHPCEFLLLSSSFIHVYAFW